MSPSDEGKMPKRQVEVKHATKRTRALLDEIFVNLEKYGYNVEEIDVEGGIKLHIVRDVHMNLRAVRARNTIRSRKGRRTLPASRHVAVKKERPSRTKSSTKAK